MMQIDQEPASIRNDLLDSFRARRGAFMAQGAALVVLGVLACLLPMLFFQAAGFVMGVILVVFALLRLVQAVIWHHTPLRWPAWISLFICLVIGVSLLIQPQWDERLLAWVVVVALILEGAIQCIVCFAVRHLKGWGWIAAGAAGMWLLAGWVIAVDPLGDPRLAGLILGIGLILPGSTLLGLAIEVMRLDVPMLGQFDPDTDLARLHHSGQTTATYPNQPGTIYGVYFGLGYHLGIDVGHDQVVHDLYGRIVTTSWDDFALGREAIRFDYPDLDAVASDQVIALAKSKSGRPVQFHPLKDNCENFAIYCKTGGRQHDSIFGQHQRALQNMVDHPILGTMIELLLRPLEYLLYTYGGRGGRQAASEIRLTCATLSRWLWIRRHDHGEAVEQI